MHDLYSFINRKPSDLKLREYVKTNNTTCFNIAKVSQHLSFTSGEISSQQLFLFGGRIKTV